MDTLNQIIDKYGIVKLNTATKYPSIMTYHNLGEKGSLIESHVDNRDFSSYNECYITEKIDGTNARIIFINGDYIIGSREELLFAKGDRIVNPQLSIVKTIKGIAEQLRYSSDSSISVLYGEVYGGNVTQASKQYTNDKTFGFRVFDIAEVQLSIFENHLDKISSWREHGGQIFANVEQIGLFAERYGLETVPYISIIDGKEFPMDRLSTYKFLQRFAETKAGINMSGKAEGIVVRSFDRSLIRKIRFEDYERTKKHEKWNT